MTKKRKGLDDPKMAQEAVQLLALLLLPFSALVAWWYFRRLAARYHLGRESIRVHESGKEALFVALAESTKAGAPVVFSLLMLYYGYGMSLQTEGSESWLLICSLLVFPITLVWFAVWSCHLGAKMIGVLIFEDTNTMVLPRDPANNTARQDFFRLKWFFDLMRLDVVKLGEIEKMTRQSGVKLFIHGAFGTIGLRFSSKQKRDECISAIERTMKKSFVRLDMEGFT